MISLSLSIVLHQMICLQVSSDTVILIYNQQTERIDGSTDRVSVQAGGFALQLIYRTHLPNWFWFLFLFLTKNIDVKCVTYSTERSWDFCHSQRWHRELALSDTEVPPRGILTFAKRSRAKKSQKGDSFWGPAFRNTSLQFWSRTCLSKGWHESKRADAETHRWQNLRVKSALQSSVLWKEIFGCTVTAFLFFPFFSKPQLFCSQIKIWLQLLERHE